MGEAKRRKQLGIPPRLKKKTKSPSSETNTFNIVLNKYPYIPYIFGFSLLSILIIDLVNFYK